MSWRSVPEKYLLHSSYHGVIVSYDDVVVGIRGVEPRLKTSVQSFENECSISWDEMNMF